MYGISKQAGEQWCAYYHKRYSVDVRSIRYPGLIGWKSAPGGGTTDYAVHIFHEAIKNGAYTSFLGPKTTLPMMYMPDAIRATIDLMEAPAEQVKERTSYNLAGFSFNPEEIAAEVTRHVPGFKMGYAPDHRQAIANSWPQSIDDSAARADWGWKPQYDLKGMVDDMMLNLKRNWGSSWMKPEWLPSRIACEFRTLRKTAMKHSFLLRMGLSLMLAAQTAFAQANGTSQDTLNQVDAMGRKQGLLEGPGAQGRKARLPRMAS